MPLHKNLTGTDLHNSKVTGTNDNIVSITDNVAVDSGIALVDLDVGIFTRDIPTTTVSLVNSGDTVDLDGTLQVDIIDEHTAATGVTIDGVLLKDGDVEATDITASGTIYGTLDKVNLATGGSLPTTGWSAASGTDWNWYYDYTVTGLTTSDFVIVSIDKDGLDDAQYSELAPSVDSVTGGIRFYCNTVPTTTISFDYTVIKG